MNKKLKILVLRFSSIGDIVLTTPVVRCLKEQTGCELHVVCKQAFSDTLIHNPHVDRLHLFSNDIRELYAQLQAENYDYVVDLHRNLRTFRLKRFLRVRSYAFSKLNLRKFIAVRFKAPGILPDKHIVDRYFEAVAPLGVLPDNKGLEYHIAESDHVNVPLLYTGGHKPFAVLVAGGSYFTKQIPLNKMEAICRRLRIPVIVLGGKEDRQKSEELKSRIPEVINLCGALTLNQSASVISQARMVISSDTGLMHIAAAFRKPLISVWGNTIPEFGMSPYKPHPESQILEVKGLSCRPCSKLGFAKCPQGHFRCMENIDTNSIPAE